MIFITDFHKGVFMVHVVNFMFMFNTFCKKQVFVTWNICNTGALYKAVLVVANCCSVHIVRLNCCRLIMYWPRITSCCTSLCLCMFCHFLGSCVLLSLKALAECACVMLCVFYDFAWCVVVYIYLSFNKVFLLFMPRFLCINFHWFCAPYFEKSVLLNKLWNFVCNFFLKWKGIEEYLSMEYKNTPGYIA